MGFLIPAIMGIGLLNSIFNRPKTQAPNNPYPGSLGTLTPQQLNDLLNRFSQYGSNTNSNNSFNSLSNTSGWQNGYLNGTSAFGTQTSPTVSPMYQPLEGSVLGTLMGRMGNESLPPGFEAQGLQGINHSFDTANMALQNKLTSSGLGGSEIGGAGQRYLEGQRAGQAGSFLANLPLLKRQLQNEDLGMAQALIEGLGKGTSQYGTSRNQQQSGGTSGSTTSSSGFGTNSSNTSGFGPPQLPGSFFQPNQNPQSGFQGFLGGLSGMLPMLMYMFGQQQGSNGGDASSGGYGPAGAPPTPYGYG